MRRLALALLVGCASPPLAVAVSNPGGTAPPWTALFERGRSWTLPVEVTTTPAGGPATTQARAAVTCTVAATSVVGQVRRATIACTDPDQVLVSYALPAGYLVATDAGLWRFPADDSWLDVDDQTLPNLDPDRRVLRWPLAAFSVRIGELDAFEIFEAWSDGADRWCATYYGQAGDRGGHELCLSAAGLVSARQWYAEDDMTDTRLGGHRLPPRPAMPTPVRGAP